MQSEKNGRTEILNNISIAFLNKGLKKNKNIFNYFYLKYFTVGAYYSAGLIPEIKDRIKTLCCLADLFYKHGFKKEALKAVEKCLSLLTKIDNSQEKIGFGTNSDLVYALLDISNSYYNQELFEIANEKLNLASDYLEKVNAISKNYAIAEFSKTLLFQKLPEQAIKCSENITDASIRIRTIYYISQNLFDNNRQQYAYELAVSNGLISIWSDFATSLYINTNMFQTIKESQNIPNEMKSNWFNGIAEGITITNATKKEITPLLYSLNNEVPALIKVIQMHALNCLFFQENYPQEKIDKFNKVLNIQWAIDIKSQLPN